MTSNPRLPIEQWPEGADHTQVSDMSLFVYGDVAILQPGPEDHDGCRDATLCISELRELAAAATWAADRLEAR